MLTQNAMPVLCVSAQIDVISGTKIALSIDDRRTGYEEERVEVRGVVRAVDGVVDGVLRRDSGRAGRIRAAAAPNARAAIERRDSAAA